MKFTKSRLIKSVAILICTVTVLFVVVIIVASPLAAYLVGRYDEEVTGRKITTGWIYVNPFTGYVHISNLKIYESTKWNVGRPADSLFFTANGLSATFSLHQLFHKIVEITELDLDKPRGTVFMDKKDFNFSDLVTRFTPSKKRKTSSAVHLNFLHVNITEGEFYFHERQVPVDYFIRHVNIESTGKRWNADTLAAKFALQPGIGAGDIRGDFTINFRTMDYRYRVIARKFDLNLIGQYLRDLVSGGKFTANLDVDLKATGNLKDEQNLSAAGRMAINDFHFGKNRSDDLFSFDRLSLSIININPGKHQYQFDTVSLIHPIFKFEHYEKLNNLQVIFDSSAGKMNRVISDPARFNLVIEIGRYIKMLSANFFQSNYRINRFEICRGDVKFNDYKPFEKFSVELSPLEITADSVYKRQKWIDVVVKSGILPYGNAMVTLKVNPRDSTDFDLQYHLQQLPVAMFNPYLVTYTSFPVDRGSLEINGSWKVRKGIIQSNNHLVIIDPRVAGHLKNGGITWLPLTVIMSLIREKGNVIDYEIPITGNLKVPEFHLGDILADLVKNIFIKPLTTPYRMEVSSLETEIEKSLTLKWQMRQYSLSDRQKKFMIKMADFLAENPGSVVSVEPHQYDAREKEYILFFEAKKKYFLAASQKTSRTFNEHDSETVDRLSPQDPRFLQYLNSQTHDPALCTNQEKYARIIDSSLINNRFRELNHRRSEVFYSVFRSRKVADRIEMSAAVNVIPYNGFSFYRISYHGVFPRSVLRAYERLNELNQFPPREKYRRERKRNSRALVH
ncbi:MAG: DUF748 domain-containing protein [Bacteroidota bacterium]